MPASHQSTALGPNGWCVSERSKTWPKHLALWHPQGRPRWNSGILALAWSNPSYWAYLRYRCVAHYLSSFPLTYVFPSLHHSGFHLFLNKWIFKKIDMSLGNSKLKLQWDGSAYLTEWLKSKNLIVSSTCKNWESLKFIFLKKTIILNMYCSEKWVNLKNAYCLILTVCYSKKTKTTKTGKSVVAKCSETKKIGQGEPRGLLGLWSYVVCHHKGGYVFQYLPKSRRCRTQQVTFIVSYGLWLTTCRRWLIHMHLEAEVAEYVSGEGSTRVLVLSYSFLALSLKIGIKWNY